FRRRQNPRLLACFPESCEIGIYKRGLLDRTSHVEQAELELRHPGAGGGGPGLVIFLISSPAAISSTSRVDVILGSLCLASLSRRLLHQDRTGWLCDFCLFPYEKKRQKERIVVRRTALPQLYEPSARG